MAKLVLLRGLPASGKSTYAGGLVMREKYKRINADDLRLSIDNGIYSKENERFLNNMMQIMAGQALQAGFNVVIDNTNLNPFHVKFYRSLARDCKAEFEMVDIDTPLAVCLQRDLERTRGRVGKEVIMRMYDKWVRPTGAFPNV